ncbi:MAG: hypothetical protein AAFO93_00120 [Pseudomonadota bacterium]
MKRLILALAVLLPSVGLAAEDVVIDPPAAATTDEGLAAWARIYEVASHPRCSNCHVGSDGFPMWSGPLYEATYGGVQRHGMFVNAGASRTGAETVPCSTCHYDRYEGGANDGAHMAPQVAAQWQLPPAEFEWFGKTSEEVCAQMRDPARNGDRDFLAIADHLGHDVILHWAWTPGGGREPAPYSLQEHTDDILVWGVAGQPCPQD